MLARPIFRDRKSVRRLAPCLVYFKIVCPSMADLFGSLSLNGISFGLENFRVATFEFPGRIHDGLSSLGFAESDGS